MDVQQQLDSLKAFKERLTGDVLQAYHFRGAEYGSERFSSWKRRFVKFLDDNFPGESSAFEAKLRIFVISVQNGETEGQRFWRLQGAKALSFIDSLKIDLENGEYEPSKNFKPPLKSATEAKVKKDKEQSRVFIVHGHDELTKVNTARFVESLGFKAIILHEQVSNNKTIIEKIEYYADVDFAIVLYTPDDKGEANSAVAKGDLKSRARQNVVFEHGYLMGKLGRGHVVALVTAGVELPSDLSGVVYISDNNWQISIAREMNSVGLDVDFSKLM